MRAITKRVFLFVTVNILILVTLSALFQVLTSVFHLNAGAESTIWIFYALIGMGGAFINLAMSRKIAKWMMRIQVLDPRTQNPAERRLLDMVQSLAARARLPMPEVGVYNSPEVNAFATGPSKKRSLVAVSTGLLGRMNEDAVEGVLGHEITHIANGDMVTMTLIQGVINTMVLIAARIIANLVAGQVDERARPAVQFFVFMGLQVVLSILGSAVVCYFSRRREYRADAGGARLAGRDHMLAGLKSLRQVYGQVDNHEQAIATLKISGHAGGALAMLFATHPPLEDRIHRLETLGV